MGESPDASWCHPECTPVRGAPAKCPHPVHLLSIKGISSPPSQTAARIFLGGGDPQGSQSWPRVRHWDEVDHAADTVQISWGRSELFPPWKGSVVLLVPSALSQEPFQLSGHSHTNSWCPFLAGSTFPKYSLLCWHPQHRPGHPRAPEDAGGAHMKHKRLKLSGAH